MRRILSLVVALGSLHTFAGIIESDNTNVVYGSDGRQDLYQVTNQMILKLALSTAAMIPNEKLSKLSSGNYSIPDYQTLEEGDNVCATEKFSEQPSVSLCSGFLIGPDTLVTAGHCMDAVQLPGACPNFSWVFDMKMQNASTINLSNISKDNVYRCKQILVQKLSMDIDYAVIKLDRPVVGRKALAVRKSGKPVLNQKLLVIGNPSGLPTKVTDGVILKLDNPNFIATNLDTFHGNSGSAVFNAVTGEVEGILVRGKTDYVPSIPANPFSCMTTNKCDATGKVCSTPAMMKDMPNEQITRISFVLPYAAKVVKQK